MDDNAKTGAPDMDIYETTAHLLGKHGKSDEEIKSFLAEQFPISSAIIQKIMEKRKKLSFESK